jgi:sodium-dependent phosphate transporter
MSTAAFAPEYTYIAVLGVICGFIFAFGIGANDVANAFGSSVSARSLKLWQAIILGSIFEFLGAILLGANVTGTIRNKIVDPAYYVDEPEVFMFGSLCALMVGMIWLLIATAMEFPVSTTHDIVAAYIGFSIAAHGFPSVEWFTCGMIFVSWFAAPIFAGLLAAFFFKMLLKFVLERQDHVFERAVNVYPLVVFVAITVNVFFILFKSDNNVEMDEWDWGHKVVLPASLGGGFVSALFTWAVVCPWIRKRINLAEEEDRIAAKDQDVGKARDARDTLHTLVSTGKNDDDEEDEEEVWDADTGKVAKVNTKDVVVINYQEETSNPVVVEKGMGEVTVPVPMEQPNDDIMEDLKEMKTEDSILRVAWDYIADHTYRQDLHEISLGESKRAAAIWEKSTEYDLKSERLFQYLQVFTACMASFAHGANDVANAIAPVSGILYIYKNGEFATKAEVNKGILAMGGAAIGLGFALFGYRIVKAVAFKLTKMSPSRGFCIELAGKNSQRLNTFLVSVTPIIILTPFV